jgi:hypothetical protein
MAADARGLDNSITLHFPPRFRRDRIEPKQQTRLTRSGDMRSDCLRQEVLK